MKTNYFFTKRAIALILLSIFYHTSFAQKQSQTKNLIVVTIDGLRWQEVFRGVSKDMLHSKYTANKKDIRNSFYKHSAAESRKLLFPFLWSVVAEEGQLYGNLDLGNKQEVANKYKFSYPGYSEIMTGFADRRINSNAKEYNPNQNVLEFINQQPSFEGSVAAFSSWDVFPYILNSKRSNLLVNSGISDFKSDKTTEFSMLNQLQKQMLSPVGDNVRPDVLTYQFGKTYLKNYKPRVLYLAFDEPDDYAHSGYYHFYLRQAHKIDLMLADLWNYIQSDPFYKNQTTLLITCDHGRGDTSPVRWKKHGLGVKHSEQTWIAVIGPDTPASGEMPGNGKTIYHNELAQTMSRFLGLDFQTGTDHKVGNAISSMFKTDILVTGALGSGSTSSSNAPQSKNKLGE
jgi:hypothetical protein